MKDCRDFQKDLPAFLEGLLPDDERKILEEHLAACRICSAATSDLKKTAAVLSRLEEVEPPPWFTQKIMARVREESERREKSFLRRFFFPLQIKVPIQAFATVAVVIMAVYLFWNTEPEMKAVRVPAEITREEAREKAETKSLTEDRGVELLSPAQKKPSDGPAAKEIGKSPSRAGGGSVATPTPIKKEEFVPPPAGTSPPVSVRKGDISRGDVDTTREERVGLEHSRPSASKRAVKSERPPVVRGMSPAPAPAAPLPRDTGVSSQLTDKTMQKERMPEGHRFQSPDFAKDRDEKKAYSAAAPTISTPGSAPRTKQSYTSVTMVVRDRETAVEDVEAILKQYGARNVVTNRAVPFTVVSARVSSGNVPEILKKLDMTGSVTERIVMPETDYIAVKIKATDSID